MIIKLLLFFLYCTFYFPKSVLAQDTSVILKNYQIAITSGIGFPSGASILINQKIVDIFYIEAGAGVLTDRYTIDIGMGIHGPTSSHFNIIFRYILISDKFSVPLTSLNANSTGVFSFFYKWMSFKE
jgi:hypothetical protein